MAPEQFEGVRLSTACDVYAVGQILWELLVGKPAFEGSIPEVCTKKMAFESGLRLKNSQSDPLSILISDCTSKDPNRRPTAMEAVEILRGVIHN
jgi:serine/threonine-protein kinase